MPDVELDVAQGTLVGRTAVGADVDDLPYATVKTELGLGSAAFVATTAFDAAGVAASAVATHEADTTNVHGITDTSTLETTTGSQTKADAKVSDVAYNAGTWDAVTTVAPSKNAVRDKIEVLAPLASPALTGTPTTTTAAQGTNTTQIASTAYVQTEVGLLIPKTLYDANSVVIAVTDDTPVALAFGASTIFARLASGNIVAATTTQIKTLLALTVGTDVQAWDTDLDAIAALGVTNDSFIQGKGGVWSKRTVAQVLTDLAAAGTTFQPLDATLTALAGLATGANKFPYSTGTDTFSQTDITPGAWTAFTPTMSSGWALGNSTHTSAYARMGRMIFFYTYITIGTTATKGTTMLIALPVTAATSGDGFGHNIMGHFVDVGTKLYSAQSGQNNTTTTFELSSIATDGTDGSPRGVTSSSPFSWATGDLIFASGFYEAAA